MDEQTYSQWQILHRRKAAGETLNPAEAAEYETGCQEIDATVTYDGDLPRMQELYARLDAVEDRQQQLRDQETQMDARIAVLESQLDEWTRRQQHLGN